MELEQQSKCIKKIQKPAPEDRTGALPGVMKSVVRSTRAGYLRFKWIKGCPNASYGRPRGPRRKLGFGADRKPSYAAPLGAIKAAKAFGSQRTIRS